VFLYGSIVFVALSRHPMEVGAACAAAGAAGLHLAGVENEKENGGNIEILSSHREL